MKFTNNDKLLMLLLLVILIIIQTNIAVCDPSPTPMNPYKKDKQVQHSLFRERDAIERMSVSHEGIPFPIESRYK